MFSFFSLSLSKISTFLHINAAIAFFIVVEFKVAAISYTIGNKHAHEACKSVRDIHLCRREMADVTERYTCRQLFYVLSRKVKAEGGTVSVVRKSDLHIFPPYMHSSSVGKCCIGEGVLCAAARVCLFPDLQTCRGE